jgi:hypothetical protein
VGFTTEYGTLSLKTKIAILSDISPKYRVFQKELYNFESL